MIIVLCFLAFFASLGISALLTPISRAIAPLIGMIDQPNLARKLHSKPIPRSGGVAVFFSFWTVLLFSVIFLNAFPDFFLLPDSFRGISRNITSKLLPLAGIFVGSSIIFITGVLDDRFDLPAKLRLIIQISATLPLVFTGVTLDLFLPDLLAVLVTICWVVFLTNSLNFLDNMNGLTSGLSVIMALILGIQSILVGEYYLMAVFVMLAGTCAGFWIYNFPNASIFLGDSGSTNLGFLFASFTIVASYYDTNVASELPVLMPLVVMGVPIFDTLTVMYIRWRNGKPLMVGDTNHFSHRMVALGMSKVEAVIFIYGVAIVIGLMAIVLRPLSWWYGLIQCSAIALVFLGIYWMEKMSRRNDSA